MSIMAAMPAFFMLVHDKLYSDGVEKKEVPNTIFTHLSRTEAAFDELSKSSTLLVGSFVLGFIADPPDAKDKADLVFAEFKASYHKFINEFREFVGCLMDHKNAVYQFFGGEWFKVEQFKSLMDKHPLDLNILNDSSEIICENVLIKNERGYNSRLADNMKGFVAEEFGISYIDPETVTGMLLNAVSVESLSDCLAEISDYAETAVNTYDNYFAKDLNSSKVSKESKRDDFEYKGYPEY
ncbi:MAG: hypothetical protein IKT21_02075 [Methanomicrobium sp.]|nr:hypothetical protein [Methanomicrobium sp.]